MFILKVVIARARGRRADGSKDLPLQIRHYLRCLMCRPEGKLLMVAESAGKMRTARWPPLVKRDVHNYPLFSSLLGVNSSRRGTRGQLSGGAVEGQVVKKMDGESETSPISPNYCRTNFGGAMSIKLTTRTLIAESFQAAAGVQRSGVRESRCKVENPVAQPQQLHVLADQPSVRPPGRVRHSPFAL